jgi:hypothetical protein
MSIRRLAQVITEPGEPMADTISVINLEILVKDLREAVEYASRAGLLQDRGVLDAIKAAEQTIRNDAIPDVYSVTLALSAVAHVIAPMTIADLTFGRNPFSPDNQRKAKTLQFWMTVFCLIVLVLVGYSMNALRVEQEAIAELNEVQDMHPEMKLTELRMIAENDEPISKRTALFDEYHQKVIELLRLNDKMSSTYTRLLEAFNTPLFPLGQFLSQQPLAQRRIEGKVTLRPGEAVPVASGIMLPPASNAPPSQTSAAPNPAQSTSYSAQVAPLTSAGSKNDHSGDQTGTLERTPDLCAEDANGGLRVPVEALAYPKWMRTVLSDTLSDFCFQLKVLSPDGQGTVLNQSFSESGLVPHIKDKVSLRVTWFLPFLYGLLGSAVFMMRNVASIRTPAMAWFPLVMRLSLGGVAGIVMGWFSTTASNIQTTTTLSVPFALAFLTGYGIDVLFTLLDRINRTIGDAPVTKAA